MIYYYNIIMLCAVELNVVIYMRKKNERFLWIHSTYVIKYG